VEPAAIFTAPLGFRVALGADADTFRSPSAGGGHGRPPAPHEWRAGNERGSAMSTTASPDALAALDLIETKIAVPSVRKQSIPRRALLERLGAASLEARVVTVTAPAGYGKSTLLAEWSVRDTRPFAWVSVDQRDNDPVVFLSHVAAALARSEPVGRQVIQALRSPEGTIWGKILPRLGSYLAARKFPVVVVLDDVHELDAQDCHDAVAALADHVGPGSLLVLAGRGMGSLPVIRLRSAGMLVEITEADLRLSDAEAGELVRSEGVSIDHDEIAELNQHAEGWAAGLYMASRTGVFGHELSRGIREFAGDDRLVVDYFRSVLLSTLAPADVEFLTRTSILESVSGPLADAVLERSDSALRLQAIERSNLFLVPLDRKRRWYRYHHLFRETLKAELEVLEPQLVSSLRLRAAHWYETNGQAEEAVEQARVAGDLEQLAQLVGKFALPIYRSGRVVTLERWLENFADETLVMEFPVVGAFGVWVHALRGRREDARRWLTALERAPDQGPLPDGSRSLVPWIAMLKAVLCRDGSAQMLADAIVADRDLGLSSFWRPQAEVLRGVATLLEGDRDSADAILAEAVEMASAVGASNVSLAGLGGRALMALDRGDFGLTADLVCEGLRLVDEESLDDNTPAGILLAVSARLSLQQGDTESALTATARADRLRPQLTGAIPWLAIQTRLELARAHLSRADPAGARTVYNEARNQLARAGNLGSLNAQAAELQRQLSGAESGSGRRATSLTDTELRVLLLLTTHLSFREIAERRFVSRNTVKSQAIAIYRKLGATSRTEAVEIAAGLGLVDAGAGSGPWLATARA